MFIEPGVQVYKSRVLFANGTRHDVIFYKTTFNHTNGTLAGLAGVIKDITERNKVDTLNGIIISWNSGAERIYGYLAKEVIGKSILELVPSDRTGLHRIIPLCPLFWRILTSLKK